jgi:hypothetical protein
VKRRVVVGRGVLESCVAGKNGTGDRGVGVRGSGERRSGGDGETERRGSNVAVYVGVPSSAAV